MTIQALFAILTLSLSPSSNGLVFSLMAQCFSDHLLSINSIICWHLSPFNVVSFIHLGFFSPGIYWNSFLSLLFAHLSLHLSHFFLSSFQFLPQSLHFFPLNITFIAFLFKHPPLFSISCSFWHHLSGELFRLWVYFVPPPLSYPFLHRLLSSSLPFILET